MANLLYNKIALNKLGNAPIMDVWGWVSPAIGGGQSGGTSYGYGSEWVGGGGYGGAGNDPYNPSNIDPPVMVTPTISGNNIVTAVVTPLNTIVNQIAQAALPTQSAKQFVVNNPMLAAGALAFLVFALIKK